MKKTILLLFLSIQLLSQEYKIPPEVISSMIEADPQPNLSFNNKGDMALVMKRDGYKPIEDLAIEELRIAGTRIDPKRYTSSSKLNE